MKCVLLPFEAGRGSHHCLWSLCLHSTAIYMANFRPAKTSHFQFSTKLEKVKIKQKDEMAV